MRQTKKRKVSKRLLSVIVALVLTMVTVLPSVGLETEAADTVISGTDGGVDYVLDSDGVLTISASSNPDSGYTSGVMKDYTTTSLAPWVSSTGTRTSGTSYTTSIKKIVIEEGVTYIGTYAFNNVATTAYSQYWCSNLAEVSLPSTLTSIGNFFLVYATSLESVTIPESVTSLGSYFLRSSGITSISIPSGITEVPEAFMYDCDNITSIEVPDTVTSIGNYFCMYCDSLTEVTLSKNVTSLGSGYLNYCTAITSYELPDTVTSIGTNYLFGCTSLTYATLPAGVTELKNNCFAGCLQSDLKIVLYGTITAAHQYSFGNQSSTYTCGTVYVVDETSYDTITGTVNAYEGKNGSLKVEYLPSVSTLDLENAIASVSSLVESDYTADSWSTLSEALAAAEAIVNTEDTSALDQDTVDAATSALNDAITALVAADNTENVNALKALVEKINSLLSVKEEEDYTADSWSALIEALTAAEEALAVEADESTAGTTLNSTLTELYDDLSAAYDGLTVATSSTGGEDTGDSGETETGYLSAIYGGYEVTWNQETDSYALICTDDLTTAQKEASVGTTYVKIYFDGNADFSNLQYSVNYGTFYVWNFLDSPASMGQYASTGSYDKTSLSMTDNVITYSLSITSTDTAYNLTAGTGWTYVEDSPVFYVTKVEYYDSNDTLLVTVTSKSTGEEEGDEGDEEETVTAEDLAAAIEAAEALTESDYADGWDLLENILEEAKAVYEDEDAAADEYAVEIKEIAAAIAALTAADSSDAYTALQELIAYAEALNEEDYTNTSYADLADALASAKEVSETDLLSVINAAIESLQAAIDALEEAVDLDALNSAIAEAEALTESDYTEESWSVLAEALAAAQELVNVEDTDVLDQETVDAAAAALTEAIAALEAAPEDTEDQGTEEDGTEADGEVEDSDDTDETDDADDTDDTDDTDDADSTDSDSTDSDSTSSDSTSSTSGKTTADASVWMMFLLAIAGCLAIAGAKKRTIE